MDHKFVQRRGLFWRTCTLRDDGIRVREWTPGKGRTFTVPYEVVFGDEEETFSSSKTSLLLMLLFTVITISVQGSPTAAPSAAPIWAVCAALSGMHYLASRCDQILYMDSGGVLCLFRARPSKRAVEKFLAEIRQRARDRMRERVLPLPRSEDPHHDRERAALLRDKGIITDAEYADYTRAQTRASEPFPN